MLLGVQKTLRSFSSQIQLQILIALLSSHAYLFFFFSILIFNCQSDRIKHEVGESFQKSHVWVIRLLVKKGLESNDKVRFSGAAAHDLSCLNHKSKVFSRVRNPTISHCLQICPLTPSKLKLDYEKTATL